MPAGDVDDLRVLHQFDEVLLHLAGEEVLIGQNQQNAAFQRPKIRLGHGGLVHQVCQQAGDAYVLCLLEVLEDRLKHIPRVGGPVHRHGLCRVFRRKDGHFL